MTSELKVLKREARRQSTHPARLQELAVLSPELAQEVARSQNTPSHVLAWLADTDDQPTLVRLATNRHTPPHVLARLATSDQHDVMQQVAGNPQTPLDVLAGLATCDQPDVVRQVAVNPQTPVDVLKLLAQHPSDDVRGWLASNPATPLATLVSLRGQSPGPTYAALKTLVEYGSGADVADSQLLRAVSMAELIPAPAALRLVASVQWHALLLENADIIARSVRSEILARLQPG